MKSSPVLLAKSRALAKETREPLLFKGTDFAQTDIEPALKD